jgi:prepilin-type N-terminal cleavage/methylation domain-containing protein
MRSSAADVRVRAGKESGYTILEILVVLVVIGTLAGLAVPSYLGFRDRSSRVAAQSNVRLVMPALEAYFTDRDTYVGATLTVLRAQYDFGIDDSAGSRYKISDLTATSYCAQNHVGGWYAWATGPASQIEVGKSSHC